MKVKMKDIAEAAGVSAATVSLVLNNKPSRISAATQEHIRSIAREMQMKQGVVSGEVSQSVKTIGLLLPDVKNGYFNDLASGVNKYMVQQGYTVFQCDILNDTERCLRAIEDLTIKNVEGIIIIPPYHINSNQDNVALRKSFEKSPIPIILLDQAVYTMFTDFVTADNKQGGYLATKHLLELGHERIGCILGPKQNYTAKKRLEGYKRALAERSIVFDDELVACSEYDISSGKECMEQLSEKDITAVFATNDLIAIGVMQYAERAGMTIPGDLSVVGYDNSLLCDLLEVKLTSIEQNAESMGEKAGEVLLGRIKGSAEEAAPRNYYFTPLFVERQSTGKI